MLEPPAPPDEAARLAALRVLRILDTPPEERFDRITRLAQRLFGVPMVMVSLVDAERQWFKSRQGLEVSETPRAVSFCSHAILQDKALVVEDARRDPRFADNPLVLTEPHVCFYAGQPLIDPHHHRLGTLCLVDRQPRQMSSADLAVLRDLAALVENELFALELNEALTTQRASDARARAVMNSVSEALLLVAPDRRLSMLNRRFEELFGVSAAEVLGRTFGELQALVERLLDDPAAFAARVAGTAADDAEQFTLPLTQRWPQRRDLHLFSAPVRSDECGYLGRLYVFRDVTHEREVERMKSEFVSVVSHELRTPMTSIKGFTSLLLDGDAGEVNAEQREYLQIVNQNVERLINLTNDLLDLSRIEAGKLHLHLRLVRAAEIVEAAVAILRPQIEAKQQSLTLQVDRTLPYLWGDRDRLVQVLTNLLSNAMKYTPAGGALGVQARVEGAFAHIAVTDTGVGIAPEQQAQLFTRFYRVDSSLTREVGGTGLGLAIVKSIVELHGGQVSVSSQPGQGSTFAFTVPLADEHMAP